MSTPREAMRLEGDPANPRLMTRQSRIDKTEQMRAYCTSKVRELEGEQLCGFIFKKDSPSSGLFRVKVYGPSGQGDGTAGVAWSIRRAVHEGAGTARYGQKNTNVLMHIMGYFKKELTHPEKEELLETINLYHNQLVPLLVPLTLLKHYTAKYDKSYLKQQIYLAPHPAELMLRNHV